MILVMYLVSDEEPNHQGQYATCSRRRKMGCTDPRTLHYNRKQYIKIKVELDCVQSHGIQWGTGVVNQSV